MASPPAVDATRAAVSQGRPSSSPQTAYMDGEQAALSKSGAFRRDFKLVILKDVGPGWQISRTRSLYPIWDHQKRSTPPRHHFSEALGRVRVADGVKELGELDLGE